MADKMMRIAGRDYENGVAKAVRTDENGYMQVTTTVDEIVLLENEEVRDTEFKSVALDLSKYSDIDFIITNTLDQPVHISIDVDKSQPRVIRDDGEILRYFTTAGSKNISHIVPPGMIKSCLSWFPLQGEVIPKLPFKNLKSKNARLLYQCNNEQPTTGSLTIVLLGRRN